MSERGSPTIIPAAGIQEEPSFLSSAGTRRAFLRNGTLATVTTAALAACKPGAKSGDTTAASTPAADGAATGGTTPTAVAPTPRESADAMDAMHEKGIKAFPATKPLVAKLGQTVRIRFMNEGMMIHPMHLHGMHMTVITKDGWPVPAPFRCDTLNIAPGERWDVLVKCTNPGTWAFHCHILPHAEAETGMFGMVTALIVNA